MTRDGLAAARLRVKRARHALVVARQARREAEARERAAAAELERLVAERDRLPRRRPRPRPATVRPARPVSTLSRRQMAGEANLERVVATLREEGPLPQSKLSERSGVGTGTITHALRALEEEGVVEPTGERVGASRVFRLARRARRSTTVRPGE